MASPLYIMAQSERKFKTKAKSTEIHALFEKLKSAFVTAPVLSFPNFKLPFFFLCYRHVHLSKATIEQLANDFEKMNLNEGCVTWTQKMKPLLYCNGFYYRLNNLSKTKCNWRLTSLTFVVRACACTRSNQSKES